VAIAIVPVVTPTIGERCRHSCVILFASVRPYNVVVLFFLDVFVCANYCYCPLFEFVARQRT